MIPGSLKRAITVSQTAVPVQVCYLVPADAQGELLDAIFDECYARWGGRDTLIIPVDADGTFDDRYWAWARAFDPDLIYSYVPLDRAQLDRIDRTLMPAIVQIHRTWNDDVRPHLDHEAAGLPALSLLAMLANADRLGPKRPIGLVSAFMAWPKDPFVTDSFGLNPWGPGWAQAELRAKTRTDHCSRHPNRRAARTRSRRRGGRRYGVAPAHVRI